MVMLYLVFNNFSQLSDGWWRTVELYAFRVNINRLIDLLLQWISGNSFEDVKYLSYIEIRIKNVTIYKVFVK